MNRSPDPPYDISEPDWFETSMLDRLVTDRLSFQGVVFYMLMVKRKHAEWAERMYDVHNRECAAIDVDVSARTWYDWKHEEDYLGCRSVAGSAWDSYVKWMEKTFGLTYKA